MGKKLPRDMSLFIVPQLFNNLNCRCPTVLQFHFFYRKVHFICIVTVYKCKTSMLRAPISPEKHESPLYWSLTVLPVYKKEKNNLGNEHYVNWSIVSGLWETLTALLALWIQRGRTHTLNTWSFLAFLKNPAAFQCLSVLFCPPTSLQALREHTLPQTWNTQTL